MTTDTLADPADGTESAGPGSFTPSSDNASRNFLRFSVLFLVLAVVGGLVLAIQLVSPDFLGGVAVFSYGRLEPTATHLFIYGWLTLGLIGAIFYAVPRVAGRELQTGAQARIALGLLVLGYAAGAAGIAAGLSEGRRLLEAPLWADAVVLLGLIGVARIVTMTVSGASELGPVRWYATAAVWWLVLLHVAGNIPGLTGVTSALQTSFYRAGLTGLWVGAAGVGLVYFLIPRLTGRDALAPTQLSVVGLWSLAFVWSLTAPVDLTYGPSPDWLDTLNVIFALGMLIPVAVIFADIVTAMRKRWGSISDSTSMHLVMAGAVAFAALPVVNLVLAFRSTSAVVGFTDWIAGFEFLAFGVAATFWLFAFVAVTGDDLGMGEPTARRWHYRTLVVAVSVVAGTLLYAGAQAGLIWLGSANSEAFASIGDGFRNTAEGLEGAYIVRLIGYALYALAVLWFAVGAFGKARAAAVDGEATEIDESEMPGLDEELVAAQPLGLVRLLTVAVVLFAGAATLVWVLPTLDANVNRATLLADTARDYDGGSAASEGREVYLREGCHVCHTQAVRPIVTDVGLGAVSQGGDYVHETPVAIGFRRLGPDLMHVGGNSIAAVAAELAGAEGDPAEFEDDAAAAVADFVASHLRDPRDARPWSTMPAYDYLSDSDIDALVAYIASLD